MSASLSISLSPSFSLPITYHLSVYLSSLSSYHLSICRPLSYVTIYYLSICLSVSMCHPLFLSLLSIICLSIYLPISFSSVLSAYLVNYLFFPSETSRGRRVNYSFTSKGFGPIDFVSGSPLDPVHGFWFDRIKSLK